MSERPRAPALGHYRLPLAAWFSIAHRLSGVLLALLLVIVVSWLGAVAAGAAAYAAWQAYWLTIPGQALLWGLAAAGSYHAVNGVRHVAWDLGWLALTPGAVQISGWMVLGASALIWLAAYAVYRLG